VFPNRAREQRFSDFFNRLRGRMRLSEDALIALIGASARGRGLIEGIGDDCAICRPRAGEDLLFTTDLFIEDVHFHRRDHDARALGRRALARSLSDIAAMGGTPRFCLVSLALPPWADEKWFAGFYRGLKGLAADTGTLVAGGDLSHAPQLVCDVMVCGSVATGKALRRDGAKPGDSIFVSGPLGGWTHRREIVPRLDVGRRLVGRATACMDLSDGLSLDLHRLAKASGVGATLDRGLPVLEGATLEQALHDGEDYELLYAAPPGMRVPGHRIGTIVEDRPGRVTFMGWPLEPAGYDHFRR
jgi:thiamine-monophosphate kinase